MHRSLRLAAAGILVAGVLTCATAQAAPPPSTPRFGPCPAETEIPATSGVQCATLAVPMDYAKPDGRKIDITVSRIKAAGSRQGSIFLNPGGPGADTLGYWARRAKDMPAALNANYDRYAVQPRGLRWSTPLTCSSGTAKVQPGAGARDAIKKACDVAQPGYLPTITTENTARDLDATRAALRLERIDFLGMSYGTYLGAVYGTLFPNRVGKLILDSNVNPQWVWTEQFAQQQLAGQDRFNDLFAWIAERHDEYRLGDTALQVYQNWASLVAAQGGGWYANLTPPPANVSDFATQIPEPLASMARAGYNNSLDHISKLQNIIRSLTSPGGSQQVPLLSATTVATNTRKFWPIFAHAMAAAKADPRNIAKLVSIESQTSADPTSRNVFSAITCNENATPAQPDLLPVALATLASGGSALKARASMVRTGIACAGWDPSAKPVSISNRGLGTPPLLLQSLRDAETQYQGGPAMAHALGGRLITVDGGDHGVFGRGNRVLDDAVMTYLSTGQVTVSTVDQAPLQ